MPRRPISCLFLLLMLLCWSVGCSRGPKVIPASKMEKIYREMFLADEWIKTFPEKRPSADTSWFYEPIFEKYGYTYSDYLNTVDHLLNDPQRYAEMVGRVARSLETETSAMKRSILKREMLRHRADSIAEIIRSGLLKDYFLYENLFLIVSRTDTVDMVRNSDGVYYPRPVVSDTMFRGPGMVFADSTGFCADSLLTGLSGKDDEEESVEQTAEETAGESHAEVSQPVRRGLKPAPAGRFPSVEKTRIQVVEDEDGMVSFEQFDSEPGSGQGSPESRKVRRKPKQERK